MREWKVLRIVCTAVGHFEPWRRRVRLGPSTSWGSLALRRRAVRGFLGLLISLVRLLKLNYKDFKHTLLSTSMPFCLVDVGFSRRRR